MMTEIPGLWVGVDGATRPARLKGGPLWESFHGMRRREAGKLTGSETDLARAYGAAVWAYRCIKLRADALAGVPLRLENAAGEPIDAHPLLALLRGAAPTLGDLLRATESAYNIFGVAYWHIPARGTRTPKALYWLNPQTVEPITDPVQGVTGYRQQVGGKTRTLPAAEVIAFRNFDPLDDLGGLSPLAVVLNEVNAERSAGAYVAAFFANDARPAGLLTTDQPLVDSEVERVQTWWERLFKGARNRWKTGIVGGGLRWQAISHPPTDLALAELRAEDRRAICAAFGVPPGLAGAWEATTYATARQQKASFYEDTMLPQMAYLAEVLNRALLPRYPDLRGARLAWQTDRIAALRETAHEKAERMTALFNAGLITRNEARAALGFQPSAADGTIFELRGPTAPIKALVGDDHRQKQQRDLARYERFALNRIKEGRPVRRFRSEVLRAGLLDDMHEALQDCFTAEAVRGLFDAVRDSEGIR